MEVFLKGFYFLIRLLEFLILIEALLSWVPSLRGSAIVKYITYLTNPIVSPIRRLLSRTSLGRTGLDVSPLIAICLLQLLNSIVVSILSR